MSTYAVVGNGASALGLGKEIDAHDKVVRCGQWANVFKKSEAGRKMTAWAWPGYAKMNKFLPPGRGYFMWITCPRKWHKGAARAANVKKIAARTNARALWMPLGEYMRVRKALEHITFKDRPPSTGMLAIHYAMMTQPANIFIAGFDAGVVGKYVYADGRRGSDTFHPYAAEAKLIGRLVEKGTWLGVPVETKADWRRP